MTASSPRTILYTGKGGVGKTSVAAATARRCAALGLRTVVVSTDPAHSLSDSLGSELGPEPVAVSELLWGQEVHAEREMEVNWGAVQRWLGALLADRGVMDIAAEELTVPPGMDELFSLLQVKRHHESGEFDVVIVDCAPTGETLRLLSFPDIAHWWLEKVFPWERRLLGAAKPLARMIDVEVPGEDVLAEVQRLVRQMIAMNEILRDRDHASIRLVINPDRMVIKEAQRTFSYLNLYGYLTDAVIVNRIFPDELAGGYFGEWRARQHRRLAEVRADFAPVPVVTARYFDQEVIGTSMLDRLAVELFGPEHGASTAARLGSASEQGASTTARLGSASEQGASTAARLGSASHRDPAAVMHTELAQELESSNGTATLRIGVPFGDKGDVGLKKVGAELVVSVGPRKRTIILPAALARRNATGAKLADGSLEVSFETQSTTDGHP